MTDLIDAAKRVAEADARRRNQYLRDTGHPEADIHCVDPEEYAERHWQEFLWAAEAVAGFKK